MAQSFPGTVGGPLVRFEGFDEFRRALRSAGSNWDGALREANRQIAEGIAAKARGMTETAQQAKAAGGIVGRGDVRGAKIGITKRPPFTAGAFFSAKQYPQFQAWVGNKWEVGGDGGPAAINPAIRDAKPEIDNQYLAAWGKVCRAAFPDGAPIVPAQLTLVGSTGAAVAQQGTGAF